MSLRAVDLLHVHAVRAGGVDRLIAWNTQACDLDKCGEIRPIRPAVPWFAKRDGKDGVLPGPIAPGLEPGAPSVFTLPQGECRGRILIWSPLWPETPLADRFE